MKQSILNSFLFPLHAGRIMPDSTLSRLYGRFVHMGIGRIAVVYLLAAWGAIQVAATVFPALHFPAWTVTAVVASALAGFPVAILVGLFLRKTRSPGEISAVAPPAWNASMIVVVAAVVIVAGAGIGLRFLGTGTRPPEDDSNATEVIALSSELVARRVLVLPFENRTDDPAFQQIGNMAADWIARGSAEITGLEVVDPATSMQLAADTTVTAGAERLSTLASDTRSAIVVSGAVYLQQDSVIFQAHITEGASGKVLRPLKAIKVPRATPGPGLEELRERVMGALATLLDVDLPESSTFLSHVPRYDAYQEFISGVEAAGIEESRVHYDAAYALDSTFVLARLWLAWAYLNDLFRWDKADSVARLVAPRRNELGKIDRHMLDYVQATVRHDQQARLDAARAASKLAPASAWQMRAIGVALEMNRVSDAMAELDRLVPSERKPGQQAAYWNTRARILHRLGRFEESLESAERAVRSAPDPDGVNWHQLRALAALGRVDEILAIMEQRTMKDELAGLNAMAYGWELAGHGHPEEARKLYEWILAWWETAAPDFKEHEMGVELQADVLLELGRVPEAARLYRAWVPGPDEGKVASRRTMIAITAAAEGDTAAAEREIQRLASLTGEGHRVPFTQAVIAASLGQQARAMTYLKRAFVEGARFTDILHCHPGLARLRGYPPFEEFLRPK